MKLFSKSQNIIIDLVSDSYVANDGQAEHFFRHGLDEQSLRDWARQFLNPNKRFIDGGAHLGAYTVQYAHLSKQVHAFEAEKRTFFTLCTNIGIRSLRNVDVSNLALSNVSGEKVELFLNDDDGGSSSIINRSARSELVTTVTIDNFNYDDVGFIKLDVEGNEPATLMGALRTIQSCRPHIMFESNTSATLGKCCQILDTVNYVTTQIGGYPHMFISSPR